MGFYSELQMALDDYEMRYDRKADLDLFTKKVHAERKMNELTYLMRNHACTKEQVIQRCDDIKAILLSIGCVA